MGRTKKKTWNGLIVMSFVIIHVGCATIVKKAGSSDSEQLASDTDSIGCIINVHAVFTCIIKEGLPPVIHVFCTLDVA